MSEKAITPIRVLIVDDEAADRERCVEVLAGEPDLEVVGLGQEGQEGARLALQLRPDVVLLDQTLPDADGFQTAELILAGAPEIAIILMSQDRGPELWRKAMRAGARECIAKPVEAAALVEAVRSTGHVREKRTSAELSALMDPTRAPRTISVTGAKGGIGKTTIAVNLAVTLARYNPREVVLLDVCNQYSDLALHLNMRPRRALAELAPLASELDPDLVEAYLMPHESGLKLLVACLDPVGLDVFTVPLVSGLLNVLRRSHRFIVVDVPAILYAPTLYVLSHSSHVFVVANLFDLSTAEDTRRLLTMLAGRYVSKERLHLVLNRVANHGRLRAEDLVRTVGHPVKVSVPNAYRIVVPSVNEGRPFVLDHADSPPSQAIRQMAQIVTGSATDGDEAPSRAKFGLRLLRGQAAQGGTS